MAESIATGPETTRVCPEVHPIGITTLFEPASQDKILADIVFVHGLQGHPKTTWEYGKGSQYTNTKVQGDKKTGGLSKFLRQKIFTTGRGKKLKDDNGDGEGKTASAEDDTADKVSSGDDEGGGSITDGHGPGKQAKNVDKDSGREINSDTDEGRSIAQSDNGNKENTGPIVDSRNRGSKAPAQHCYWPVDILPDDFQSIRIMTYGYDSNVSHFCKGATNQLNITQHGHLLLQTVTHSRSACRGRPIIFVAHSLGGVLVKDAMIVSLKYKHQKDMQDVAKSTYAIIFFGTPHLGAKAAEWGLILSNILSFFPLTFSTNKLILRSLSPDSEKLLNVTSDFNDILDDEKPFADKIKIYSFQEGKGLSGLSAFDGKVVPDTSSFFNRKAIEQNSFINENHMNMCRFKSNKDAAYNDFKSAMETYLGGIKDSQTTGAEKEESKRNAQHTELVRSLALDFQGRLVREDQLGEILTSTGTYQWIWSSPFATWLSDDEGIFWICGKPASGKSTLMSYLSKSKETQTRLAATTGSQWRTIHFFFDFRAGKEIHNNFEGLLRSLLHQIASLKQSVAEDLDVIRARRVQPSFGRAWSTGLLRTTLETVLRKSTENLCIFLDGLDEYEGQQHELITFLTAIWSKKVKICLASRPEPLFREAFRDLPKLKMQELNRTGIEAFTASTMRRYAPKVISGSDSELLRLSSEISQKAEGVFLWARFAVFELTEGWARGEDFCLLQQRLEKVPSEVEDIYSRILQRLSPTERQQAGQMLQFVCTACRTLTLEELLTATKQASENHAISVGRITRRIRRNFERRTLAVTGNMLESYRSSWSSQRSFKSIHVVRLIHRTVLSYLESKGWSQILGADYESRFQPNALWLDVCTKQLPSPLKLLPHEKELDHDCRVRVPDRIGRMAPPTPDMSPNSSDSSLETDLSVPEIHSPLREYAALHMLHHASAFEIASGLSSYPRLLKFMSSTYIILHRNLWKSLDFTCECFHTNKDSPEPTKPLHLAIAHGLELYVADAISSAVSTDASQGDVSSFSTLAVQVPSYGDSNSVDQTARLGPEGMTALEYAVRYASHQYHNPSNVRTVLAILKKEPEVDDKALAAALKGAPAELVQELLRHRSAGTLYLSWDSQAKPSYKNEKLPVFVEKKGNPLTPMWLVAQRQYRYEMADFEEILNMLIERGEDINGQCGPAGTALHAALFGLPSRWEPVIITLLVSKGADINKTGPYGNALEFTWRLANTSDHKMKLVRRYQAAIGQLIDLGGINTRPDPNGMIPTKERMLWFCGCDFAGYLQQKSDYIYIRDRCPSSPSSSL